MGWSAFVGLVLLGSILRIVLSVVYQRLAKRIDEKIPDDLPLTAGAWLDEQVFQREADVRVLLGEPSSWNVDAFVPSANTIILSSDVYNRRDASFWAIAAHELGHALVYGWSKLVGWPFLAARLLRTSGTEIATVLIFANVLYARRDIDALAFALLGASLIATVVVLIDEALASIVGIRILARDARVSRPALVGAITALLAAFMTYLGAFVGQLILVQQRDFIIVQIERHRHFEPGNPMPTGTLVVTTLLSIFLAVVSARAIVASLKKRAFTTPEEVQTHKRRAMGRELGRSLIAMVIVWLVWNRPLGPLLALFCVAGILASRSVFRLALSIGGTFAWVVGGVIALVVGFLVVMVAFFLRRLVTRPKRPKEENAAQPMEAVNLSPPAPFAVSVQDMTLALYNDPPWYERASALAFPALHIAFVIGTTTQLLSH